MRDASHDAYFDYDAAFFFAFPCDAPCDVFSVFVFLWLS